MKSEMDKKVEQMRSQSMSFSNNGMEISINVPDTVDVKSAFGSVISTVVQQQDEILHMNHQMQKIAEENAKQQRNIVAWAQRCMLKLEEQNQSLKKQLVESQLQIKNLTYNLQGFVDPMTKKDKILDSEILQDVAVEPPPSELDRLVHPMFPTENGAEVSDGFKVHVPRQTTAKSSFPKSTAKKIAARDFYYSIGPNVLPNRRVPAKRWRWAMQKVLTLVRSQKFKAGFTRTRLEHSQTIVERLNRIEQMMFQVPLDLRETLGEEQRSRSQQTDKEVKRLDAAVEKLKVQMSNRDLGLQQQLAMIEGRLSDLSVGGGGSLELKSPVQGEAQAILPSVEPPSDDAQSIAGRDEVILDRGRGLGGGVGGGGGGGGAAGFGGRAGDDRLLEDKLQLVERNVREIIQLDFTRSKMGIEYAVSELQSIEQRADTALQSVSSITNTLSTLKEPQNEKDEIRYLTEVLRLDTQLRAARAEISSIEGALSGLEGVYRTTQQHIDLLVQHQGHHDRLMGAGSGRVAGSELQSMLGSCAGIESLSRQVRQTVLSMKVLGGGLDGVIESRWKALNKFTAALGEIEKMASSLANLQENVTVISSSAAELAERQKLLENLERGSRSGSWDGNENEDGENSSAVNIGRLNRRLSHMEEMLHSLRSETHSFAASTKEMLGRLPQSLVFSEDDMTEGDSTISAVVHDENGTQTDFEDGSRGQIVDELPAKDGYEQPRRAGDARKKKIITSGGNRKAQALKDAKKQDDELWDEFLYDDIEDEEAPRLSEAVFDDSLIESAISQGTAAGIAATSSSSVPKNKIIKPQKGHNRDHDYGHPHTPVDHASKHDDRHRHHEHDSRPQSGRRSRPHSSYDDHNDRDRSHDKHRDKGHDEKHGKYRDRSHDRDGVYDEAKDRGLDGGRDRDHDRGRGHDGSRASGKGHDGGRDRGRDGVRERAHDGDSDRDRGHDGGRDKDRESSRGRDSYRNKSHDHDGGSKFHENGREILHEGGEYGSQGRDRDRDRDRNRDRDRDRDRDRLADKDRDKDQRPKSKKSTHRSDSDQEEDQQQRQNSGRRQRRSAQKSAGNSNSNRQKVHSASGPSRPNSANVTSNVTNPFTTVAASRPTSASGQADESDLIAAFSSALGPDDIPNYSQPPESGLLTEDAALAALLNPNAEGRRRRKGGSVGGSGGDEAASPEEISNLAKVIRLISARVDDVNRNKLGNEQAVALFRALLKEHRSKDRGVDGSDNRSVDSLSMDMEKHIHDMVKEMHALKKDQDLRLKGLKTYFDQTMEIVINRSMDEADAGRDAVANTRALCLGCGRHSTYKLFPSTSRPGTPQPNSFLPALNSSVQPGPDIYRSGFRMPVRASSPSHKKPFQLEDDQVRVTGQSVPTANIPGSIEEAAEGDGADGLENDTASLLSPSVRTEPLIITVQAPAAVPHPSTAAAMTSKIAGTATALGMNAAAGAAMQASSSQRVGSRQQQKSSMSGSANVPLSVSQSQPLLRQGQGHGNGQSASSQGQGQGGQEALPMFRKGFPGKKSLRAETAYAPERFDLPVNAQQQPLQAMAAVAVKPNKTNKLSSAVSEF